MWSPEELTVTGEEHRGQLQCSDCSKNSRSAPGSRSSPSTSTLCHCHQPSPLGSFKSHFKCRYLKLKSDHFSSSFSPEGDPGAFTLSTLSL